MVYHNKARGLQRYRLAQMRKGQKAICVEEKNGGRYKAHGRDREGLSASAYFVGTVGHQRVYISAL